ncbi:MAG: hypothetical protein KJ062_07415 [Thermoanaerobaculia bacterium]|nr:hypothetical protein [Thermoanaerobaculia bacterium]
MRPWIGPCLLLVLASCRPAPDAASVTIVVRADVTGFFPNPPTTDESFTNRISAELYEGLVRFDRDGRLAPGLASRWQTPDERTYAFQLRAGLRFADGTPLAAEDVAASLRASILKKWPTAAYLRHVASVESDGPLRVVVRTRVPYPLLLYKLPWGYVLPAGAVDLEPVPVLGAGPYRLVSREPGRTFTLERNPHFGRDAPAFERARFDVVPDAEARIARVLSGSADIADDVPLDRVDALRQEPGVKVFAAPTDRVLFLTFRVTESPFSDPRVREAVDLAVDRGELVRRAYDGKTVTASQLVPATVVGFNPALVPPKPDRDRARALLAEAGYPDGLDVPLDGTHNRYVNDVRVLREVARQLALVGIRTEVRTWDKAAFFERIDGGRSPLHLVGWACGSGEAGEALEALVATRSGSLGTANSGGWSDPVLDALVAQADRTTDPEERVGTLQMALARVAETRPVLPLLLQTEAILVSRRVDWQPGLDFRLRIEDMRPAPSRAR